MTKPTKRVGQTKWSWLAGCGLVAVAIVAALVLHTRSNQFRTLNNLQTQIQQIQGLQQKNNLTVIDVGALTESVSKTQKQIDGFDLPGASNSIKQLQQDVSSQNTKLQEAIVEAHAKAAAEAKLEAQRAAASTTPTPPEKGGGKQAQVPIIMYHKPPADFAAQMTALKAKGYTTIHMSDLANYFAGTGTLPAKPVVVTFDDGYTAQQAAIPILQQNGQKATLYLIVGGPLSHYCIGILRTNTTCGDAYLNINDIKGALTTGVVEIGAHTIDHPDLAAMSADDQWNQINGSRQWLRNTFGQEVTSFAYPYGEYNATSEQLAEKAGFSTAVTTQPGLIQYGSQPYLLSRVRAVSDLP